MDLPELKVVVAASTAEILIPAVFGLIGTIVGALISRAVAVSQHRADKDADVRLAGARCLIAFDEVREENSMENVRSARARLVELGFAAISAGIDTRLALGASQYGSENILFFADADMREGMRADPLELAIESAAALVAAVDTVPYRRRRGPFMEPDMKRRADKFNVMHEMFNPHPRASIHRSDVATRSVLGQAARPQALDQTPLQRQSPTGLRLLQIRSGISTSGCTKRDDRDSGRREAVDVPLPPGAHQFVR